MVSGVRCGEFLRTAVIKEVEFNRDGVYMTIEKDGVLHEVSFTGDDDHHSVEFYFPDGFWYQGCD